MGLYSGTGCRQEKPETETNIGYIKNSFFLLITKHETSVPENKPVIV